MTATATATIVPLPAGHHHADDVARHEPGDVRAGAPRGAVAEGDRLRYERNLGEILAALGLDLDTPGTRDTPRRLLAALIDATQGYEGDPKLITSFPTECRGGANCELAQIVEGPIPFHALCEHHALPFFGRAWLGYVAHEEILGIRRARDHLFLRYRFEEEAS